MGGGQAGGDFGDFSVLFFLKLEICINGEKEKLHECNIVMHDWWKMEEKITKILIRV